MIVGILFSPLSDKYGRRPLLLVNIWITLLGYSCFLFFANYYIYFIGILLVSAGASLNSSVTYVYLVEITAKRYQRLTVALTLLFETSSALIAPLIYKYISTRFQIVIVIAVIAKLVSLVLIKWIIESPKYLIAEKNYEKYERSKKDIVRFNKKFRQYKRQNYDEIFNSPGLREEEQYAKSDTEEYFEDKVNIILSFKKYFKHWFFNKNIVIFFILWFTLMNQTLSFVLIIAKFEGDILLNAIAVGLAQVLGCLIAMIALRFFS